MIISKIKSWLISLSQRYEEESDNETRERVLALAKEGDYGLCPPPMNAQVALNELIDHLLGEDWYVTISMNTEQSNTVAVYEIERKYKRVEKK